MKTLTDAQIQSAAKVLYEAEQQVIQIEAFTQTYPNMTMDDAYAIQSSWVALKKAAGDPPIGYKIGLTSKVMQRAMKIDMPDYGVLLQSMHFEDGSNIPVNRFTDPRIEVELAFVLKDRLFGEDLTIEDVLAATDYVTPALELISARSYRVHPQSGYTRTIFDTIADNAANAGIITGGKKVKPNEVDLRWCGALLKKNSEIEETGLAAAVLNHPANGVCWIAKRFAKHDVALEPGQILLAGSFTAPIPVGEGDHIHADFGKLGSIHCQFIGE